MPNETSIRVSEATIERLAGYKMNVRYPSNDAIINMLIDLDERTKQGPI